MTSTKKSDNARPFTRLCAHTLTSLHYGDANLVDDLLGKKTFTEVLLMQILGRPVRAVDVRIADAVLVVLMEHGLTPSSIATRLVYMSAPENLQGAVASGLLAVGSQFVGTMENCSRVLDHLMLAEDPFQEALAIAREHKEKRQAIPGFGHHLHKPVDPRAYKLLELGNAEPELRGQKIATLEMFSEAVDEVFERPITINATGAVAALLGELGVRTEVMRGFAVISRSAGLVAHITEEQASPSGRFIWETVEEAIPPVSRPREQT
ncbi:Citrate synthase 2 (plasmid) [Burkholderia sp. AD24]|nr:Citrate synthase 2 [Burkholderia sp. AD24]